MDTHEIRKSLHRSALRIGVAGFALVLAAVLSACSGGGATNTGTTPTPTPTAKTTVQVSMGDAPSDWMLAFTMNISSMSLNGSNGSVNVISTSMPMEMMHLMGTMQPIAMVSAPQGTYTGASITIGSATVMYMDPIAGIPVQATISGPIAGNVTFSSSVTVGSTPMAMGFDLDLANSVTMGSSGSLSMNPVFHVTSGMQGSGNPLDPTDGGIQEMMGMVSSVSGSSFSMSSMQATQGFTFATNSSTVFNGTSMGSMGSGMLLLVDASFQSDGTLMANRVQSMMGSGGMMGSGVITAVTGQPATSLTMVMQNGVGAGTMTSMFADGATVDLTGVSAYEIDDDNVDMSGLPFTPVFDASHIYAGQSVMPVSSSGMMSGGGMGGGMMGGSTMAGTINATKVELQPQGLSGTVATAITSGAQTSFTLALPAGCAFTTLTGATNVTIYQQQKTVISTGSSIASGSTMHVNGLLFLDGGQWKMVAARMGSN
jgi:hypothetical protein